MAVRRKKITTVGTIDQDVLLYTAGRDVELDHALIEVDCLGTAAHVTMLSRIPGSYKLFSASERKKVVKELGRIIKDAHKGQFKIKLEDQDVHLAVEKRLTQKLGVLGKRVHTARSRNDQVALDLRLFGRDQLVEVIQEVAALAEALLKLGQKHVDVPMVGRTHMQPAMPSSVGLWATAFTEGLLDDIELLFSVYQINNQSPLGSAAGYGVPVAIDRVLVSRLLGFTKPCHNVLYAGNARGKVESVILSALSQVMLTISRLAQDLILFTMPEYNYFSFPAEFGTGSSIMPQKVNPDVLELVRAKASVVQGQAETIYNIVKNSPSGYNRDLQETKGPYLEGFQVTRSTVRIMTKMIQGLKVHDQVLRDAFTPGVFATDAALEMVMQGTAFRDAYNEIKQNLDALKEADPDVAIANKKHVGGTAGLDFDLYTTALKQVTQRVKREHTRYTRATGKLMAD